MSVFDAEKTAESSEDIWQLAPEWVTPAFLEPEHGVLHALALSSERTRQTKTHKAHACKTVLPNGSLYALNDNVFVCSPEFVFLQLAQSLELEQLIAYGCEICGTYGFDKSDKRGFRDRDTPLITKAQLERYVESAYGMRGRLRAREALRYIMENAASPMETVCMLLLTLPYRLGGYGLPKLLINVKINVPSSMRPLCPKGYCVADIRVPDTQFVIEYLGIYDHAGGASMQADRGRVIALRELGFEVLELSGRQVWNLSAFEIVAKRVAKVSGKRIRSGEFGATKTRLKLREALHSWNSASGRASRQVS